MRLIYTYLVRIGDAIKIGSTYRPHGRMKQLRNPEWVMGLCAFEHLGGYLVENKLHAHFKDKRIGNRRKREFFHLSSSDIESVKHFDFGFPVCLVRPKQ